MSIEVYFILAIIGISSFPFWKWIFKKLIKDVKKQSVATWITTIIFTPLIYAGIICLFIFVLFYYPNKDFDASKWRNDSENRFEMSKDLIENKLLIGKTKVQVENMLGKTQNFNDSLWIYELGFVPSLGNIDPDILEITFKDGVVISVIQRNT